MVRRKFQGFTLIELLVVIAIIGILATMAVLSLSDARAQARDAKRAHDIRQIQTAVELFKTNTINAPAGSDWDAFEADLSEYLAGGLPADPGHPSEADDYYIYCADGENYALMTKMEKDNPAIFNNSLEGSLGYNFSGDSIQCSSSSESLPEAAPTCGTSNKWFCLGSPAPAA